MFSVVAFAKTDTLFSAPANALTTLGKRPARSQFNQRVQHTFSKDGMNRRCQMRIVCPNTRTFRFSILFGEIKVKRLVQDFSENLMRREHEDCRLIASPCEVVRLTY